MSLTAFGTEGAAIAAQPASRPPQVYKQLDGSVEEFGTDTLLADTTAIESSSPGDATYQRFENRLASLGTTRNVLTTQIKNALWAAEFRGVADPGAAIQLRVCSQTIHVAAALAAS